ncbi:MAG TPA: hypothetical protein VGE45_00380 [Chloroflexia bacterium]|jgi:hypothetical protein
MSDFQYSTYAPPLVLLNLGTDRCPTWVNPEEIAAMEYPEFDQRRTKIILKSGQAVYSQRPIYEVERIIRGSSKNKSTPAGE